MRQYLAVYEHEGDSWSAYDLALARKVGARQMLFWEADYIDLRPEPQRSEIMKAMRKSIPRE